MPPTDKKKAAGGGARGGLTATQRAQHERGLAAKAAARAGLFAGACSLFKFASVAVEAGAGASAAAGAGAAAAAPGASAAAGPPAADLSAVRAMQAELAAARAAMACERERLARARGQVGGLLRESYAASYGGGRRPMLLAAAPTVFPTARQTRLRAGLDALFAFAAPQAGPETVGLLLAELDAAADDLRRRDEGARGAEALVRRLAETYAPPRVRRSLMMLPRPPKKH